MKTDMTQPLFRLTDIGFSYASAQPVLKSVNLTLNAGDRIALTGPNGAGKTTLLHVMVGLTKPQTGTVEAFGRIRHNERDFADVRPRAGLLFQDADDQLFCPTVIEDVAFGPLNLGKKPAEARRIAEQTLASLGLQGFENRITYKLSGGQKRLVALASVLAMAPDVLLLDEPTNALDVDTQERLTVILQNLPQSMVIISHDHGFLDRIANRRFSLSPVPSAPPHSG